MKDIKIAVACHKPSVLPRNSLFVPVQVGAAIAAKRMDNMRHDDEGENISDKNQHYCELTAQYWAWKNLEADYYGLCHYRRFLCFADVPEEPRNERKHIEAYAMDDYNLKKFGLEDEQQMRAVIEANDVVVGELQRVSGLYTPRGYQNTAYKHWAAHDRALIKKEDLDAMLNILEAVSPVVGKDARKYLNTNTFLGFNCFVMKKELFQEMCEIEFEVLKRLEKVVDLRTYNQQLQRIYGFMGEIICSSYIYHIEKQNKYKVKHVPILYFNYTDILSSYEPEEKENTISVLFMNRDRWDFMFGTAWKSFLDNVDKNYNYDVIIETVPFKPAIKKVYDDMAAAYDNVKVRYMDHILLEKQMLEQHKKSYELLPFMPWKLPAYSKMLVFDTQILFKDSVVSLWEEQLENDQMIAAPYDAVMQAKINDIFVATADTTLRAKMKDPYNYFSCSAMLWNFEKYRDCYDENAVKQASTNKNGDIAFYEETLNVLCENRVKIVDQRWNTWLVSNERLKDQLPYAPYSVYSELLKAQKNPAIIRYEEDDPWRPQGNQLDIMFWGIARQLPIYERYLSHLVDRCTHPEISKLSGIVRFFPVGTRRRKLVQIVFPRGSLRYRIARRLV